MKKKKNSRCKILQSITEISFASWATRLQKSSLLRDGALLFPQKILNSNLKQNPNKAQDARFQEANPLCLG